MCVWTLDNPFALVGKNTTLTFWYSHGKCSFWLIQPMFMYWKAFPVRSWHILVRSHVYARTCMYLDPWFTEPHHLPPTFCFNIETDVIVLLQQLLTPNVLQRLPSGERSYCYKNLVSVCTLKHVYIGSVHPPRSRGPWAAIQSTHSPRAPQGQRNHLPLLGRGGAPEADRTGTRWGAAPRLLGTPAARACSKCRNCSRRTHTATDTRWLHLKRKRGN